MENLLIYGSILDMLDELTNEEAGLLFKALNSFRKGDEVEFEDRYLKGIWKGILPNLNKLKENYDSKVKANQENGKKGGRPKSTPTKKEEITDTIIPQPIQDIQKEVKVSKIKEKVVNIIKFDDSHFPEELKLSNYTQEEYDEINSYIKGDIHNAKPNEKKPHQDNIFNSTIEF